MFAFDCLFINGRSLLKEPLEVRYAVHAPCPPPRPSPAKVRRAALYGALQEVEGEMQFATAKTSRDVDELQV